MRYLVFTYMHYYPGGGMTDCCLLTNDREKAMTTARMAVDKEQFTVGSADEAEVYDTQTGAGLRLIRTQEGVMEKPFQMEAA